MRNRLWWRDVGLALIALVVGLVTLRVAVSGEYAHFVKPSMQWPLAISGSVMVLLALWHLYAARRAAHDDGHDHHGMLQVGALLLIPMVVLCVLPTPNAGPALVARKAQPKPSGDLPSIPSSGVVDLRLDDFVIRATHWDQKHTQGRTFRFVGFIARDPKTKALYVSRLKINCCVADALVYRALVLGAPDNLPDDLWVEVEGVALAPEGGEARAQAVKVTPVPVPEHPFMS